ncbi:asparagine synthase [Leifsonia kafniensis]
MVSEGVMLAEFAARMALKNQIVIGALAESLSYDPEYYAESARAVLTEVIRESEGSAQLAEHKREVAAGRGGVGEHQHDYRAGDTANLRRREDVNLAVADRLAALRDDDDYVARLVARARDDAWGDIGQAITARLDRELQAFTLTDADADYWNRRDKRMRQLRREVAQLARESSKA